jgi:hypothetical protein
MPTTDTKPELTAKASMALPVSQPAVYANGLKKFVFYPQIFKNHKISNFRKFGLVGFDLFQETDGQTDMTKLIVDFRSFFFQTPIRMT